MSNQCRCKCRQLAIKENWPKRVETALIRSAATITMCLLGAVSGDSKEPGPWVFRAEVGGYQVHEGDPGFVRESVVSGDTVRVRLDGVQLPVGSSSARIWAGG